jgi:hypothetical protein
MLPDDSMYRLSATSTSGEYAKRMRPRSPTLNRTWITGQCQGGGLGTPND